MRHIKYHSDEEMLKAINDGSENGITELFYSFFPSICYYALQITKNQQLAEDIASDSFIKLWAARKTFRHFRDLKSYLYRIAHNKCIDWLRQNKRVRIHENAVHESGETIEASFSDKLVRADFLREASAALETLPEQCRKVMKMFYFDEMTMNEIADKLELSPGTVRTQKARGLALLRKKLLFILPFFSMLFK